MTMVVNCAVYSRFSGQKLRDIPIDLISENLDESPDHFIWLGLHEPDVGLMKKVQQEFGLHDLVVEDAHRAHQRPKMDVFDDVIFIVMHTARLVGEDAKLGETHVMVGPRFVLTIRHGASQSYAPVRARCEQSPKMMKRGPGYVLYAVMDFVVDNYFPVVEEYRAHLERLEHAIFDGSYKRATIRRLYDLKRELVRLRLAVGPLQDICNQLTHIDNELVPDEINPYYRDVHDHVIRINDAVDALTEMLSAALEVHLALISVGQNEVVKRLASWAAILALPTMVASFYGMNFEYMPELQWKLGYPLVLSVMGIGCFILYRRLRRAGWL
ncbi:MAG: magnesium/cobalt transporter CorA [Moraxellaceae bacterium]